MWILWKTAPRTSLTISPLTHHHQITYYLVMIGTGSRRKYGAIKAAVKEHEDIIQYILPPHVLSGWDTVSALWSIGKGTVICKVLKSGKKHLNTLGITRENDDSIILQSVAFVAWCYGHQNESNMTALRYLVCISKMANHRLSAVPQLRLSSSPPTPPHPKRSFQATC